MKKLVAILVLCLTCAFCAIGFAACDENTTGGQDTQILSIYNTYVAYAEENGETPLSYEEWFKSIKATREQRVCRVKKARKETRVKPLKSEL
ncbi:MAG: hypothetical protein IJQ23_03480 [Clostridia bacterium]|nr:hypothetical protein [Clostridia bacterium]